MEQMFLLHNDCIIMSCYQHDVKLRAANRRLHTKFIKLFWNSSVQRLMQLSKGMSDISNWPIWPLHCLLGRNLSRLHVEVICSLWRSGTELLSFSSQQQLINRQPLGRDSCLNGIRTSGSFSDGENNKTALKWSGGLHKPRSSAWFHL